MSKNKAFKCPKCGSINVNRWFEDESFYFSFSCKDCGYTNSIDVLRNRLKSTEALIEQPIAAGNDIGTYHYDLNIIGVWQDLVTEWRRRII